MQHVLNLAIVMAPTLIAIAIIIIIAAVARTTVK